VQPGTLNSSARRSLDRREICLPSIFPANRRATTSRRLPAPEQRTSYHRPTPLYEPADGAGCYGPCRTRALMPAELRLPPSMGIQAIALGKLGKGGFEHERMKPFIGAQLVQVQPGQSRSEQAGSESCLSSGDRWGLKRRQRGRGPRGISSEIFYRGGADAVSLAEGRIWTTARARSNQGRRSPKPEARIQRGSPGTQESSSLPPTSMGVVHPTATNQAQGCA
jgi:hypothetical protein